jgi:glycosyltransferase involved in cell wall biosynthesis
VRPRRLLQVIDSVVGGGAEQHAVDLAVALRERGWELAVACSTVGSPGGERNAVVTTLADHGIDVRTLGDDLVKRRVCRRYAGRIGLLIDELSPDVVHSHIFASAAASGRALASRRHPLVVTEHTEAPWRDLLARRESAAYYARADRILCVSRAIHTLLRTTYGVPPAKLRLMIPVGRAPAGPPRPLPRHTSRSPVVGFVGRLCPEKGVDVLLGATPAVLRSRPDARVVVIGSGPEERRLQQLACDLRISDSVTFLGQRDDVLDLLHDIDVLAVPSRSDGAPLVIHEAMQAGVAVVGAAVGGIPDRLGDGSYGILVPPGRCDALGDAVAGLLVDPDARARLSRVARRAAARHTFSGMVDTVERAYAEAIAHRSGTPRPAMRAPAPVNRSPVELAEVE